MNDYSFICWCLPIDIYYYYFIIIIIIIIIIVTLQQWKLKDSYEL